jgi:uncharacterized FAD-dependent dehydrogenase
MKTDIALRISPADAANEVVLKKMMAAIIKVKPDQITAFRVVKRSIDARRNPVIIQLTIEAWVDEKMPEFPEIHFDYPDVSAAPTVIVVGAGPGGFFAAMRLIERGIRPVVLERGKAVSERKKDVALLNRNHPVDSESNYAFGEGGAGTFSDGKLYTRSTKRGDFNRFLEILCFHGADKDILIDAHPHIGTDKLPRIMRSIRETIIRSGGEVHFQTRVDDFILDSDRLTGVITANGDKVYGEAVILATGHSARDIYELLNRKSILIEAKPWALGVRVEHPQELVDQIQYHTPEGRGDYLPAASYSFSCQVEQRGVYSFCMCPGGIIVPAMSGPNEMVVNGMSASGRNSPFANSGMVVEVHPDDLKGYEQYGALSGLMFQREVERSCYINGGKNNIAPAQMLTDFVNGRLSADLPETSYLPGVIASPLHFILPEMVAGRLRQGFEQFGKWARGFLTDEAIVLGVESRTSSPVRIPRLSDTLSHPQITNLYPCGEGAGYAGGIASSALDGERCADRIAERLTHQ